MASNLPLTIQCGNLNMTSLIVFNSNTYEFPQNVPATYWIMIVNRTDLTVVENFQFNDATDMPSQLTNYYTSNPDFMMILTTNGLTSDNLPAGDFYNFLISVGAGPQLQNLEQMYGALNCSVWAQMGYTLVTVLDSSAGYEFSDYQFPVGGFVSCLTLMPIPVGTGVLYTPVANS